MTVVKIRANTTQPTEQSQQTYFISDLHLDPARIDTINLSLRFFAHVEGAQALFIIGDLFEYWLGDDAGDPRLTAVFEAISAVSASGTSVYLMHGNRDFLLGDAFATRVGATLLREDHIEVELGEVELGEVDAGVARYSLLHGDTLCTDDVDYLRLRQMLRDTQWQAEFLALSIEERIAQAQALREKSRDATAAKVAGIMDVNEAAVLAHNSQFPNDGLIHGHTHRPFDHPPSAQMQRRVVLGDWKSDHAMIARFDGNQLLFERYE